MANNLLRRLNVRVVGDGDSYLVLAHGMGTDQSSWHRVLPYFTPFYKVVLYDLPCAGTVDPETFDFRRYSTLDTYVDDVLNILDALQVTRCTYVGHSTSAMIGLLAAIRRRELFVKLVLIGVSPRFMNDVDYSGGFEQEDVEVVFAAMHSNYAAWVHGFAPLVVGVDLPEVIQEFSRTLFNMRPDISLFVCQTIFRTDFRGVLGLVRVPCFIIQSLFDHAVPVFLADYLRQHLGGPTSIIYVETNGHLPQLSDPATLSHALTIALQANPPSR